MTRWGIVAALFALSLASIGCSRFNSPSDGNRPPFLRVQVVVPSDFPTERVGFVEIDISAAGAEPLVIPASFQSIGLVNGVPVNARGEPDPTDPTRRRIAINFGSNPFKGGQRTTEIFLYPQFSGDAGLSPPLAVKARIVTPDNQLLGESSSTTDQSGAPIRFGGEDRTVQIVVTCAPGGACAAPIVPQTATITVTRAPNCPSQTALAGKLYAILFPTGPNAGQGQLFGVLDHADFTAPDASATVTIATAPAGSYALLAVLDVGNDLPVTNLAPQRGDLASALVPFSIFQDRVSTASVQLETIVEVGTCAGGRTLYPPTLFGTDPRSPGQSTTPSLLGTSSAAGTVSVFTASGCTGAALASAAVAAGARFAIAVTVPANGTATFFANVTTPSGQTSACTAAGIAYANDAVPPTLPAGAKPTVTSPGPGRLAVSIPFAAGVTDDRSTAARIVYDVCLGDRPLSTGGCQPFAIAATTAPTSGTPTVELRGLADDTTYYVAVRAKDEAGNPSAAVDTPARTQAATGVVAVATGAQHTCAIVASGAIACFGQNADGQLGAVTPSPTPTAFTIAYPRLPTALEIAAGAAHTCARTAAGEVHCWGKNDVGQLGDGTTVGKTTPTKVALPAPATRISAGDAHTCALLVDGTAQCWGSNAHGQLGRPDLTAASSPTPATIVTDSQTLTPIGNIRDVALGGQHTCFVIDNGDGSLGVLGCAGANDQFQIPSQRTGIDVRTPALNIGNVERLAVGQAFTCMVQTDKTANCFGRGTEGQLGDAQNSNDSSQHSPIFGPSGPRARSYGAGSVSMCAVMADGSLRCWGNNDRGQLGDGTTSFRETPGPTAVPEPLRSVATSGEHTCAIGGSGALYCWGRNDAFQAGAASGDLKVPTAITFPTPRRALSVSAGGAHACARLSDGAAACWGENGLGMLGDGTTTSRPYAASVLGLDPRAGVASVGAGSRSSCLTTFDGKTRCFGAGTLGELGDGTRFGSTLPSFLPTTVIVQQIPQSVRAVQSCVGDELACLLANDGHMFCWGRSEVGQTTTFTPSVVTPAPVTQMGFPLNDAYALACGERHACYVSNVGRVGCWGDDNEGQLDGAPRVGGSIIPTSPTFTGNPYFVSATASQGHSCAIAATGELHCWGRNTDGQLGAGDAAAHTSAVKVGGLPPVVRASAGVNHTCALTGAGAVYCWGGGTDGQLGQGGGSSLTPVLAIDPSAGAANVAIDVSAGAFFSCAVMAEGTVKCWGRNDRGQGGSRGASTLPTPTLVEALP